MIINPNIVTAVVGLVALRLAAHGDIILAIAHEFLDSVNDFVDGNVAKHHIQTFSFRVTAILPDFFGLSIIPSERLINERPVDHSLIDPTLVWIWGESWSSDFLLKSDPIHSRPITDSRQNGYHRGPHHQHSP